MRTKQICVIFALAAMAPVRGSGPAEGLTTSASSLRRVRPAALDGYSPSSLVMTRNRARTLGDQATATGDRYFSVTDLDLQGKSNEEIVQRLAPKEVMASEGVRRLHIVVDVERPLTIRATGNVSAGTAVIDRAVRHVEINSTVRVNQLKVIAK